MNVRCLSMKTKLMVLLLSCNAPMACSRAIPSKPATPQTSVASSDHPAVADQAVHDPDRRAIFDALLEHVLSDSSLQSSREFYGTPGDRKFALVSDKGYGISWPDWYVPSVDNFESVQIGEGSAAEPERPRLLGIRLDKFNLDHKSEHFALIDGQIEVTIFNAGGSGGELPPIGGCSVYFDAKRTANKWAVEYKGALDP